MTDFTSSSSRRKAPSLDPEYFTSWEMLFINLNTTVVMKNENYFMKTHLILMKMSLRDFALLNVMTLNNLAATRKESKLTYRSRRKTQTSKIRQHLVEGGSIMRKFVNEIIGDGISRLTFMGIL